jgi:hypothetical protein
MGGASAVAGKLPIWKIGAQGCVMERVAVECEVATQPLMKWG